MTKSNDILINVHLVQQLIATQFPQWAHLSIKPVANGGIDNRTFHLGQQMIVRLPSADMYSPQIAKEHQWLPILAPHLPLSIPTSLAMGKPCEAFPWYWSIYKWLEGETATIERIIDLSQFAITLATFVKALQRCDAKDGPIAGPHNFYRGGSLKTYDTETRNAIAKLSHQIDADAMTTVWDIALASTWDKPPVWIHGDVAASNLLIKNGQFCAVIDFGLLGVGDPACDLAIAWTFFKEESRQAFRKALPLDKATWARGRGWVLWKTLCAPVPGTDCLGIINQVLDDHKREMIQPGNSY